MNEFREWLSDNLRYIMLGVGILLGLVVIFFGIRFIASAVKSNPANPEITTEAEPTPSDTSTASPTPDPTVEVLVLEELIENGVPEITTLIKDFYNAYAAKDGAVIRTLVDNFSLEDETVMYADTVISYRDIHVYTKITQTPGVYIVFTTYQYELAGINTMVPGLAQWCVHTANDGSLYISSAGPNANLQLEIDQTLQSADAQALIHSVQTQYDAALASDPALYAFFYGTQPPSNSGTASNNNGTANNSSNNNNNNNNSNNNNNNNNNSGITPEPTWSPDSKPIVDTDGGIIATPTPPKDRQLKLKERAFLYEKADTNSSYIRPYPKDTNVVKLEEEGDFYYVNINGEKGYMLKSCF